jgi:sugar fermentation stimulation protein A
MLFPPLTEGKILRRYKRFFADIELPDSTVVVAHVANTGSMKNCWVPHMPALISQAQNPDRKLKWSLEFTCPTPDHFIMVNTSRTNEIVQDALTHRQLVPFQDYSVIHPEQKFQESRIDFKLSAPSQPDVWIEVKNVTLMEEVGVVCFPDAVSTRGQKHLLDLIALKKNGHRAAMLYVASRSDAKTFKPAKHIDPTYTQYLSEAHRAGVEIYCYLLERKQNEFLLTKSLPIEGVTS